MTIREASPGLSLYLSHKVQDRPWPPSRSSPLEAGDETEERFFEYATLEEIRRVEQLELTGFEAEVRDWWMFSFYAGGVRFSDLAKLQYRNLTEADRKWWISYEMTKTGEGKKIRLPEPAVKIIEEMKSAAT